MSDFSVIVLAVFAVLIAFALYICILRILNRRAASRGHMQHTSDDPRQNMLEKDVKSYLSTRRARLRDR